MWSVGAPYAAGSLEDLVGDLVAVPRRSLKALEGVEVSVGVLEVDEGLASAGVSGQYSLSHAACLSHLTLFSLCRGGFGGGRYVTTFQIY